MSPSALVLHKHPLNTVLPGAPPQQRSNDDEVEQENVEHSDKWLEPTDDRGNDSDSDWSYSKYQSNNKRKKQKKGRKLNEDVTSTTQTTQANTNGN